MGLPGFLNWLIEETTINKSQYRISSSIIHVEDPNYRYVDKKFIYNLDIQRFYNDLIKVLTDIEIINKIDKIYIDLENSLHQLKKYPFTSIGDSYKIIDLLIHYMFVLNKYNNSSPSKKIKMMLTIDDVPIEKTRDKLETDIYFRDRMFNVYNTLWTNELNKVDLSKINVQINNKVDPTKNYISLTGLFPTDRDNRLNLFNILKTREKDNISLSKQGEGEHNIIKQIEDDIITGTITSNILVDAPDADTIMLIFMSETIMDAFLTNPDFNIYLIMNSSTDNSYLFNIREVIDELFIQELIYDQYDFKPTNFFKTYFNPFNSSDIYQSKYIEENLFKYSSNFSILCLLTSKNDFNNKSILQKKDVTDDIYTFNLLILLEILESNNLYQLLMRSDFIEIFNETLKLYYNLNEDIMHYIDTYIIVPNITFEKERRKIVHQPDFTVFFDSLTYKKFENLNNFIKWLILYYSTNKLNNPDVSNRYQLDLNETEKDDYYKYLLDKLKIKISDPVRRSRDDTPDDTSGTKLETQSKDKKDRNSGGGISLNQKYKYYLSKYNLM